MKASGRMARLAVVRVWLGPVPLVAGNYSQAGNKKPGRRFGRQAQFAVSHFAN
jgi:hypothetical protein